MKRLYIATRAHTVCDQSDEEKPILAQKKKDHLKDCVPLDVSDS
jgi:hypothetical protein